MKRQTITAIDVGTTKVATIIAEMADNGVRVVGVGITPSLGLHKGLVVNIGEARESIRQSVRKAELACNYKVESAYVGVTGRHVTSQNNSAVVAITRNDRLVRSEDLKRVLSSAQSVKVTGDRRLLHVIPRSYAVDGQEGVKNPVGMHGYRLDVETHVITAGMNSIQNLVKCVRGLGIDIEDLVLEPLASSEAVLAEEEKQAGVILADIGGGTTDVAIFRDGSIWHTAILPVAGYQLTRDVSIGLGLPFEVAEQMKKRYATVMPVYDTAKEKPAVSADGHGVSYQDLCDIIRARTEEIIKLIMLELPSNDYHTLVPAGLVLTGGSSNLPGIDVLAHDIMRLPARVGSPMGISGIAESLADPAYATGTGLMLWGARHGRSQTWRSKNFGWALRGLATRLRGLFSF